MGVAALIEDRRPRLRELLAQVGDMERVAHIEGRNIDLDGLGNLHEEDFHLLLTLSFLLLLILRP